MSESFKCVFVLVVSSHIVGIQTININPSSYLKGCTHQHIVRMLVKNYDSPLVCRSNSFMEKLLSNNPDITHPLDAVSTGVRLKLKMKRFVLFGLITSRCLLANK